jgi:hypothetical protein
MGKDMASAAAAVSAVSANDDHHSVVTVKTPVLESYVYDTSSWTDWWVCNKQMICTMEVTKRMARTAAAWHKICKHTCSL